MISDDLGVAKIIRSNRKTVSLQITDHATLVIRAPFRTSIERIRDIVKRHKRWIDKNKKIIEERYSKTTPRTFNEGEQFFFLGEKYNLKIVDNQYIDLLFDNQFYLHQDAQSKARQVFTIWYKEVAHRVIGQRINVYAQMYGFKYDRFSITNAMTRWGSCSKRNINFTWRLIMAPLSVIDYVVVHELVHIEEKNHSQQFWNKVREIIPDYDTQRKWLKDNGYLLNF